MDKPDRGENRCSQGPSSRFCKLSFDQGYTDGCKDHRGENKSLLKRDHAMHRGVLTKRRKSN
jgi:hypothetical protein